VTVDRGGEGGLLLVLVLVLVRRRRRRGRRRGTAVVVVLVVLVVLVVEGLCGWPSRCGRGIFASAGWRKGTGRAACSSGHGGGGRR